jgi:hypothetical protein
LPGVLDARSGAVPFSAVVAPRLLVVPTAALSAAFALAAPAALGRKPPRRPRTKGRLKATRKGTHVTARWRRCRDARRVQLKALITGGCDAMSGRIEVRGEKARKFEAGRVLCPDGTEPDAAGNCPSVTSTTTTTTTLPMVGGTCSLAAVESIVQAGGTLVFDCDGPITVDDTLTVAAGISVTLDATGHDVTISGGGMHRVFDVAGSLTLVHLTVSDGLASGLPGGPPHDGGDGTTGMDGADGTFGTDSQAPTAGAPGTDGGTPTAGPPTDGGTGGDGEGGAIRIAAGGTVTATSCTFESNVALGALGGAGCTTPGCLLCNGPQPGLFGSPSCGFGGNGGGGGGKGGAGGRGSDGGAGGDGGRGGEALGGAIYNEGALTITAGHFEDNSAVGGSGGDGGDGGNVGDGGSAAGGAVYSTVAPTIDGATTFAGNTVGGGAGGNVGCSGPAGCAGEGGSEGDPGSSHVIGGMPGGTGGNPGSDGAPGAAGAAGSAQAPDVLVE